MLMRAGFYVEEWTPGTPRYRATSRQKFWNEWNNLVGTDGEKVTFTDDDRGECIMRGIRQTSQEVNARLRYVEDPEPEIRIDADDYGKSGRGN